MKSLQFFILSTCKRRADRKVRSRKWATSSRQLFPSLFLRVIDIQFDLSLQIKDPSILVEIREARRARRCSSWSIAAQPHFSIKLGNCIPIGSLRNPDSKLENILRYFTYRMNFRIRVERAYRKITEPLRQFQRFARDV